MNKRYPATWAVALMIAMVTACAQQRESAADMSMSSAESVAMESAADVSLPAKAVNAVDVEEEAAEADVATQLTSTTLSGVSGNRKLVRTANVRFRVKDVYQAALEIENAAADSAGFVAGSDIRAQIQSIRRRPLGNGKVVELAEYVVTGDLTIRVPSERTQEFLHAIAGTVEYLDQRDFKAVDVQFDLLRQYLDQQRIAETQRALSAMAQQNGRVGERQAAIESAGQSAAARDHARIEQLKLNDQIDFSTIRLSIYQPPELRTTESLDLDAQARQHSPGFFSRLGDSLAIGWYGLLEVLLQLSKLWPLWLLMAVPLIAIVGLWRFVKRRRRSKDASAR
ncbi:MAG: DUF4349 domain-containing protein [Xanthomonadaceae bacterium]|nr:DUF4349 domain-containing protein [Xanthomonadaceae bacterium]